MMPTSKAPVPGSMSVSELLNNMKMKNNRVKRDRTFWQLFKLANDYGINKMEFLRQAIGFEPIQRDGPTADSQLLLYHQFVIPNETRWECKQCGICCSSIAGPEGQPKACEFLLASNLCGNYKQRWVVCRQFPFNLLNIDTWGTFLLISEVCEAFDSGPKITPQQYNQLILQHQEYAKELLELKQQSRDPGITLCFVYDVETQQWKFKASPE